MADEKHSWLKGQRVYIATTAGRDCILGASVAQSASQPDLKQAYGIFAQEATALDAGYAPHTVNTDGWPATQGAWKALFPNSTIILCFLHASAYGKRITPRANALFPSAYGAYGPGPRQRYLIRP